MLWNPANYSNGNTDPRVLHYRKLNSASVNYATYDTANDNTSTTSAAAVAGEATAVVNLSTPAISTDVAHGGMRLVGAFIELEYIGTAENHSGTIEVGFHPHCRDDSADLGSLHFANDSEIIQMPYYRRYKPLDGARCIWFPIDYADFQFNPVGQGASVSTQPTKPIAVQWCININGLQPSQNVRVHCCNVYESIPDESQQDLYSPKRENSGLTIDSARSAISKLMNLGFATTPSKTGAGWSGFYEKIKTAAGMANTAFSAFNTFMGSL